MSALTTLLYHVAVEPTSIDPRTRWFVESGILAAIGSVLLFAGVLY